MNIMEHIIDVIVNKPIYLIVAVSLALMIIWALIKKLYNFAIIFGFCSVVYFVYIYIENPAETEKKVKKSVESIGKKAKTLYHENGEKIVNDSVKSVGETAKKMEEKVKESVKSVGKTAEKMVDSLNY